jgi:Xaa-Pro aminopeptidase
MQRMIRNQLLEFMRRIGPESVAILASAPETPRSNDTFYRYRQDSDFFYLTGFAEPEAIAVLSPSRENGRHKFTLFVRPRDPERAIWDGPRAGVEGAVEEFGADEAFPIDEFPTRVEELLTNAKSLYYKLGAQPQLDQIVLPRLTALRSQWRKNMTVPQSIVEPSTVLYDMRLVKDELELEIMQRAADISAEAHREAMEKVRPGMQEFELEAVIEYVFRKNGALAPAYTTIVGGGPNAVVLHYINNDAVLRDGDLVLVDAGSEYQGYASDITRTFPINGRFTDPQRDIYELVLKAQTSTVDRVKPGISMDELNQHATEVLTEGMVELGLLSGDPKELIETEKHKRFYPHKIGHYIGLDVHDVGSYHNGERPRPLEPGMVVTIEPGLYIPPDAEEVPEKYRGIGVRIEDDVLVTQNGAHVLTSKVPKRIDEIEALMSSGR